MSSRRRVLLVPSNQPGAGQLPPNPLFPPPPHPPAPQRVSPHAIYVVTYARGGPKEPGGVKPYHWVFLIQAHKDSHRLHRGIVHQLKGVSGNYHYEGDETAYVLCRLGQAIDKVEVGSVDSSKLYRVAEVLNRVPIVNDKKSPWNCQDWATRGLELMRLLDIVGDRQVQRR